MSGNALKRSPPEWAEAVQVREPAEPRRAESKAARVASSSDPFASAMRTLGNDRNLRELESIFDGIKMIGTYLRRLTSTATERDPNSAKISCSKASRRCPCLESSDRAETPEKGG